jgi:hypothetical protein
VTLKLIDVGVLESQLNVSLSSFAFPPAAMPIASLRKRAATATATQPKMANANVSRLQYLLITLLMICFLSSTGSPGGKTQVRRDYPGGALGVKSMLIRNTDGLGTVFMGACFEMRVKFPLRNFLLQRTSTAVASNNGKGKK